MPLPRPRDKSNQYDPSNAQIDERFTTLEKQLDRYKVNTRSDELQLRDHSDRLSAVEVIIDEMMENLVKIIDYQRKQPELEKKKIIL